MKKFAAAAAALVLTASAAVAQQGVEIENSRVYQDSVADYYDQFNYGSGDQELTVNSITGKVEIEDSYVYQWNETDTYQYNTSSGDQTMHINRIHGE